MIACRAREILTKYVFVSGYLRTEEIVLRLVQYNAREISLLGRNIAYSFVYINLFFQQYGV